MAGGFSFTLAPGCANVWGCQLIYHELKSIDNEAIVAFVKEHSARIQPEKHGIEKMKSTKYQYHSSTQKKRGLCSGFHTSEGPIYHKHIHLLKNTLIKEHLLKPVVSLLDLMLSVSTAQLI